jgi:hypothetical protein
MVADAKSLLLHAPKGTLSTLLLLSGAVKGSRRRGTNSKVWAKVLIWCENTGPKTRRFSLSDQYRLALLGRELKFNEAVNEFIAQADRTVDLVHDELTH